MQGWFALLHWFCSSTRRMLQRHMCSCAPTYQLSSCRFTYHQVQQGHEPTLLSVACCPALLCAICCSNLTTPDIKWLGVRPSDLDRFNIPAQCRLAMTDEDLKTGRKLVRYSQYTVQSLVRSAFLAACVLIVALPESASGQTCTDQLLYCC
jgi:hypothetical protein